MKNTSILDNLTPVKVIPAFSTVAEDALYTVASVEESYTNIMKEIGIYELSLVMEGKDEDTKKKLDLKAIFTKFKETAQSLWQKFIGLVQTARDRVEALIISKVKDLKSLKLNDKDLKDAITNASDWKKLSVLDFDDSVSGAIIDKMNHAVDQVKAKIDALKEDQDAVVEINVEGIVAGILAGSYGKASIKVTEADVKSASDFKAKLVEALVTNLVDEDTADKAKAKIVDNFGDIYGALGKSKADFDKSLKDSYKSCKTKVDTSIKEAKKAADKGKLKAFKPMFKSLSQTVKLYSIAVGAIETAYIKVSADKFRVLLAAATLALKARKDAEKAAEEVVKNSADITAMESTTFQTELKSLFTF